MKDLPRTLELEMLIKYANRYSNDSDVYFDGQVAWIKPTRNKIA
jgi:hypothetical protein